jgi:HEAT repeat protein
MIALTLAVCIGSMSPAVKGQQQGLPLEVLRKEARQRIQQMEAQFELSLASAARMLSRVAPDDDSPVFRAVLKELLPWAGVFPEKFLAQIKSNSSDRTRQNLIRILAHEGSTASADALLSLLPGQDDGFVLVTLGNMADPGPRAKNLIWSLASTESTSAIPVRAEALKALARMKDRRVLELARSLLTKGAAEPLGSSAAVALALVSNDPRGDADLLRTVAAESTRALPQRAACIRALGAFPQSIQSLRTLHDSLSGELPLINAALDALSVVGDKNTSKNYLLKLVKDHPDEEVRVRAAIVLSELGVSDGAAVLISDLKRAAEDRAKEPELRRAVADRSYQLHACQLALEWYERTLLLNRGYSSRAELKVWAARCRARLGQFDKAKADLKEAGYDNFSSLVDDPAFAGMRQDPRYEPLFRQPE